MSVELIPVNKNQLSLVGDLTMDTVPAIWQSLDASFNSERNYILDLVGVSHCDSAGLSLLIYWIEQARKQQVTLQFKHAPEQLLALAKVSEVDALFQ